MKTALFKKLGQLVVGAASVTLVACGGGGGNSVMTLTGVAATGLAIDGGAVVVQCASGTGNATTLPNGSYSVSVDNGEGPCLVTVTKGDVVLQSISPKTSTGTAVANVTPLSNAIVTALIQAKGASSASSLVSNPAYTPSNNDLTEAVTAAVVQINQALVLLGQPTLDPDTDLLGSSDFVAATADSPDTGSALDKALDALVTNGSLSSELTEAINQTVDDNVDPSATGSVN
jgi:hypothetical protein